MRKQNLTRCRKCNLDSRVPILDECMETPTGWLLRIVCTSCHEHCEMLVRQETAEEFDRALDEQKRLLVSATRRFMQASMQEDIERFVIALNADAILPEDFV